jgi:hypothetical protein
MSVTGQRPASKSKREYFQIEFNESIIHMHKALSIQATKHRKESENDDDTMNMGYHACDLQSSTVCWSIMLHTRTNNYLTLFISVASPNIIQCHASY